MLSNWVSQQQELDDLEGSSWWLCYVVHAICSIRWDEGSLRRFSGERRKKNFQRAKFLAKFFQKRNDKNIGDCFKKNLLKVRIVTVKFNQICQWHSSLQAGCQSDMNVPTRKDLGIVKKPGTFGRTISKQEIARNSWPDCSCKTMSKYFI